MRGFLVTVSLSLLLAVAFLRTSHSITIKRWLLPVTAATLAAILAACFATWAAGGTTAGYAVGLPLGLSAGCLLHHLLEYCHSCGATPSLRQSVLDLPHHHEMSPRRCPSCRHSFVRRHSLRRR